jgi:hypothetical protein
VSKSPTKGAVADPKKLLRRPGRENHEKNLENISMNFKKGFRN